MCPNGIRFRRADIHRGDDHHDAWIIYDSPKCLQKPLLIRPRSVLTFKTVPEIETEDSEFNRMFRCFCEDKAEAFYALTPELSKAQQREQQKIERANREHWWDSAEYGEPSGAQSTDE